MDDVSLDNVLVVAHTPHRDVEVPLNVIPPRPRNEESRDAIRRGLPSAPWAPPSPHPERL